MILDELVISRKDLFALLEYSCSIPTGTIIGKRWRRDIHAYCKVAVPEDQHEWQIGEYVEHADPEKVGIRWMWAVDANHEPHQGKRLVEPSTSMPADIVRVV